MNWKLVMMMMMMIRSCNNSAMYNTTGNLPLFVGTGLKKRDFDIRIPVPGTRCNSGCNLSSWNQDALMVVLVLGVMVMVAVVLVVLVGERWLLVTKYL